MDVTWLPAQAPLLLAGLAVGSSGHGVFKAVLDFGEEGRVVFSDSFWQSWHFLPLSWTPEKEGEDNAERRESPGSAAAVRK